MIGQYLIDMVDEAGYLTGDLEAVAEKLGAPLAEVEAVLAILQTLRSARRLRAQSHRMPGASSSRSATASIRRCRRWSRISISWPSAILPRLRRLCGVDDEDLADMIARDPQAQSQARPRLRLDRGAADRARRVRARRRRTAPGRSSSIPTRCRRCWSTSAITREVSKTAQNDKDKTYLADCLQTATWLVRALDQRAKTILKVVERDRAPAGRLLRARRAASAAAQSEDRRRRHQHARIDGLARHRQQIHGDQPRHFRAEIFLHLVDRRRRRRRGAFGRSRAPSHPAADRRPRPPQDVLSDDTIVDRLREAGIDIARRTVAKYREAMRIPSSVQRRREKQARGASVSGCFA